VSYVIQNFTNINKKIIVTPRLKTTWLFYNLNKISIFFKIKTLLTFNWEKFFNHQSIYNLFIYYFFARQLLKYIYTPYLKFMGDYDNKITRTSLDFFLRGILLFNNKNITITKYNYLDKVCETYLYNLYLLPIRTVMFGLTKFFYKNIFFSHLLAWNFIWFQHPAQLRFYLNFILVTPSLNLFKFYSNYFLKVYNY